MVRNYKKKRGKEVNEDDITNAVFEVVNGRMKLSEAAETYNIKVSTLFYRIKRHKKSMKTKNEDFTSKYTVSQIFTNDEENMLSQHLLKSSKMNYGLSYKQARVLAYEYSTKLKKCPPKWTENKEAGIEWLKSFMRRHKELTLRKPENTSLSRSTSFNKHNVTQFYDKYEQEQDTSLDDESSIEEPIEDQQTSRRRSLDPLLTQVQNSSVHTVIKYDPSSDDQSSNQDSIDQQPLRQQSSDQYLPPMENSKTVYTADTAIRPTYVIPAKKQKTTQTKQEQVLNSEPNVLILKKEWDTIGKSLGIQLRDLDRRQLTIAQKMISDVIFYAKMGTLNEESIILLRPSSLVSAVLPPLQSTATTHCNYED